MFVEVPITGKILPSICFRSYFNYSGFILCPHIFVSVTEKVWESEYSDCSDDDVVVTKEEDAKVKIESPAKNSNSNKKIVSHLIQNSTRH